MYFCYIAEMRRDDMNGKEIKYTLEELEKKLTAKERAFCHEYIIDWNGARAARAAGYSETSIYNISSENLTKLHIKQYIDFIKDDIATEAGLSKLGLIKELKLLAFSNLTQILAKIETNGISSLTEEEQRVISEYEDTRNGIKIKTHDKRGAIQDILKAMGWNEADKLDHTSTDGSMSPTAIEVTVRKSDENKT